MSHSGEHRRYPGERRQEGMAESLCNTVSALARTDDWSESAFQQFFLEHYSRVAAILLRVLGERSRAEELASDVFWKLYRDRRLPPEGNPAAWLYRTATNAGIDALRADERRRRYEQAAGQDLSATRDSLDPLRQALGREQQAQVRAVLAAIKPAQALALILRTSGFSYKEVAEALGIQPSSVGATLLRAVAAFRQRYVELQNAERLEWKPGMKEEP